MEGSGNNDMSMHESPGVHGVDGNSHLNYS
jgi:hypothetical protein